MEKPRFALLLAAVLTAFSASVGYAISKLVSITPWIGIPIFVIAMWFFIIKLGEKFTQEDSVTAGNTFFSDKTDSNEYLSDYEKEKVQKILILLKSGEVPVDATSRAIISLLRTKSKKDAHFVARIWTSLSPDSTARIEADDIVDIAFQIGEITLANNLKKRLNWISDFRLYGGADINLIHERVPINNDIPVMKLAHDVINGKMVLDEAKKEVLLDKNLFLTSEISLINITEDLLPNLCKSANSNDRELAFVLASLIWAVARWLDNMFKPTYAKSLAECTYSLPPTTKEMFDDAIRMMKIASNLWDGKNNNMSAFLLEKIARWLVDDRNFGNHSANIELALQYLDSARKKLATSEESAFIWKVYESSGIIYLERIKGDPKENAEKAIEYLIKAQKHITSKNSIADKEMIQIHLERAYYRLRENKPRVFISYSHADEEFVDELTSALTHEGVHVWLDKFEIAVGKSILYEVTESGIGKSDALIVVLSNNSVKSRWVKEELEIAFQIQLKQDDFPFIYPVLKEDCEIPLFLQGKKWADFREGFYDGFPILYKAISSL